MDCNQARNQLDDYLDESLDAAATQALSQHLDGCSPCAAEFGSRQNIRALLTELPIQTPDGDFLVRAVNVAAAADDASPAAHNGGAGWRRLPGFRTALAAAFALVFVIAVVVSTGESASAPSSGYPEVTMATNTVTPIKLMFESAEALEDARLSLKLPVGVELVGYDDRLNLSWTTDLEPGKNVLQLPLVGRMPGSNQLIAKLEHPKGTKTFQLQLTVQ